MFITTRSNEVVWCRPTRPAVKVIFSCVTLGRRILSPAQAHFVFGLGLVLGKCLSNPIDSTSRNDTSVVCP